MGRNSKNLLPEIRHKISEKVTENLQNTEKAEQIPQNAVKFVKCKKCSQKIHYETIHIVNCKMQRENAIISKYECRANSFARFF